MKNSIETGHWKRRELTVTENRKISALLRKGSGVQLIYIPGTWSDAESAIPFLSFLNCEFSIAVIDMPGHGSSSFPPMEYSIEALSADVIYIADALGFRQFAVSGHSLGGMASVDIIRKFSHRLICSIPIEGWTCHNVQENAFGRDNTESVNPAAARWLEDDMIRRTNTWLGSWSPEQRKAFGTMWRRWNGYEILATARVPVLEIWGDRGRKKPAKRVMQIPDNEMIQIHWVKDTCHKLTVEKPQEVANVINEFISGITKGVN